MEEDLREENRRLRLFRILTDALFARLHIEPMTLAEAEESVIELRETARRLFPGKEGVFDLVISPRMERVIRERFGEGALRGKGH